MHILNQMFKAMKYIKKYSIAIICVLILLLAGKSCQSCSRGRALQYERIQHELVVDSIQTAYAGITTDLQSANDSIKILNTEISALKEMNGMMQGSLDHARQTNNSLVRTINAKSQN